MQNRIHLILASSSPRRRELLAQTGYSFAIEPPDANAESTAVPDETARELVLRHARDKGLNVAARLRDRAEIAAPIPHKLVRCPGQKQTGSRSQPGNEADTIECRQYKTPETPSVRSVIVACDTVAVCDGAILGKPQDRADAERMLRRLAGSEHEVLSGLFLLCDDDYGLFDGPESLSLVRTTLFMEPLDDEKITDYLDSGLWRGKAGAFGYQDGNDWVHILDGSESNVVGLPMEQLTVALREYKNNGKF